MSINLVVNLLHDYQEFKVCSKGQCVDGATVVNTAPIDGGWSEFGPYTTCSRTCGGGLRFRERQCNNPL